MSWLKVWLYATTGFTSIFAWGFNAFGEAFFIMNIFHAIQYFGIVWATTLVVSIMHFWYDGFIWSVRRREV